MSLIFGFLLSPIALLIVFSGLFVLYFLQNRRSNSLFAKIPQPGGQLPVIGHSLLLLKKGVDITESSFEAFYKYAVEFREYGLYAFKLAFQPTVHIFAPDHFEKLMTSSKHIQKSTGYYSLLPWLGTGLIVSSGEQWHKYRKMLTPAFHFKILDQFNPLINKHALILCDKIKTTLNYRMDNCVSALSSCALDTICETSMGVDMKTQTDGKNKFSESFIEFSKLATLRTLNTLLNRSDSLYAITPNGRKSKVMIENMHQFTEKIIKKRKNEIISTSRSGDSAKKNQKTLLDLMLDIHLDGDGFSLKDIQFQLDNFAFAGHDTVSNAVAFTLICLANYSDIQQRVRTEVNQVISEDLTDISSEHLSQFPYLEMVIKESLRVYSPVPFIGRLLHENFECGGHIIPKGTDIWLNIFALHRNPKYWTDPEKFDPERFSAENSTGRHPFAFVPFSGGLRNCIGQRYAKAFMKIVIAQIVRKFEIVPVTRIGNVKLSFEMTIKTMEPMQLEFKPLSYIVD